jgi:hypothetical protein
MEDAPSLVGLAPYSQQKRHWQAPGKTVVKLETRVLNLEVDWSKNQ